MDAVVYNKLIDIDKVIGGASTYGHTFQKGTVAAINVIVTLIGKYESYVN